MKILKIWLNIPIYMKSYVKFFKVISEKYTYVSEYFFVRIVAVSTEQSTLMIERILYDSPHYLLNG